MTSRAYMISQKDPFFFCAFEGCITWINHTTFSLYKSLLIIQLASWSHSLCFLPYIDIRYSAICTRKKHQIWKESRTDNVLFSTTLNLHTSYHEFVFHASTSSKDSYGAIKLAVKNFVPICKFMSFFNYSINAHNPSRIFWCIRRMLQPINYQGTAMFFSKLVCMSHSFFSPWFFHF